MRPFLHLLLNFFHLGPNDYAAVTGVGVVVVVILVVSVCRVEFFERNDFGGDGVAEAFLRFGFGFFGGLLLLVGAVENDGAILCSHVIALAVQGGGIVRVPEPFEHFFKRD